MNFQELVDSFHAPTCILSVKKRPDGGYRDIRIVACNKECLEHIEHPDYAISPDMQSRPKKIDTVNKFVPDSPYERYLPKNLSFEDLCYRSAVGKKPIHTYVRVNEIDLWFNIFCMPIDREDGDTCYCSYTTQPSTPEDIGIASAGNSSASEDVIKTCIKLHSTKDFHKTIEDVIKDIRLICKAEGCTILLADSADGNYSILATNNEENSKVKKVTEYSDFGRIAATWFDMVTGVDCFIIKDKRDMDYIRTINYPWYCNLINAGVKSLVFFPLRYDNEILGFVWAYNFDTENTMRIKETLELTTFFLSSKLSTYKMMEHLRRISYSDQLTGIPNRFACTELVGELIRNKEPFTLVSIDINSFKSINDTMGFDTGNRVLVEIASRWNTLAEAKLTGTRDYVARMGGDEFALIIRDHRSDEEIANTIAQYESVLGNRMTIDEIDFYITASFGYSLFPEDGTTADSLITYANASMREVKRINSSDHIMRFTPDLLKAEHTLEIESKLITALENDTLFFMLQPQFDMSHKLRGFEALARMKDTDGNIIPPGEFIPVAEKVGLVDKVDSTVMRKAASFIGDIIRRTDADMTLSVNVSVRHLMKNDFLDEIRDILKTSGIPSDRLEIEITESIMIDSAEKAQLCIEELRRLGLRIAIDDFGTGFSSLSYLNRFPADLLKIDKSFIDKMNTSDSSKQYVAAIISMGHIMGFEVISEGVEEQKQLDTLKEIGCDMIQGFIWGRPLSEEAAEKLITDSLG